MSDVKLGFLIKEEAKRDAVHVAIAPVIADETLKPGERIGFAIEGDTTTVSKSKTPIGIVDPFLTKSVKKGEKFYMCLFPGTISSLRHDWTHMAFSETYDPLWASKLYVKNFAEAFGYDYDWFMTQAEIMERYDNYFYDNSESYKNVTLDPDQTWEKFWEHYNKITGREVTDKWGFFTCSC